MFASRAGAMGTHPTHRSRLFLHNGLWVCLSVRMICFHWDIKQPHESHWKLWDLSFVLPLWFGDWGRKGNPTFQWRFCRSCSKLYDYFWRLKRLTVCSIQYRYYWPLYWADLPKDKSPPPCRAANGKCFKLFSLQHGGSALMGSRAGGLEAEGLHD